MDGIQEFVYRRADRDDHRGARTGIARVLGTAYALLTKGLVEEWLCAVLHEGKFPGEQCLHRRLVAVMDQDALAGASKGQDQRDPHMPCATDYANVVLKPGGTHDCLGRHAYRRRGSGSG